MRKIENDFERVRRAGIKDLEALERLGKIVERGRKETRIELVKTLIVEQEEFEMPSSLRKIMLALIEEENDEERGENLILEVLKKLKKLRYFEKEESVTSNILRNLLWDYPLAAELLETYLEVCSSLSREVLVRLENLPLDYKNLRILSFLRSEGFLNILKMQAEYIENVAIDLEILSFVSKENTEFYDRRSLLFEKGRTFETFNPITVSLNFLRLLQETNCYTDSYFVIEGNAFVYDLKRILNNNSFTVCEIETPNSILTASYTFDQLNKTVKHFHFVVRALDTKFEKYLKTYWLNELENFDEVPWKK